MALSGTLTGDFSSVAYVPWALRRSDDRRLATPNAV
jgi:hypothetical protein